MIEIFQNKGFSKNSFIAILRGMDLENCLPIVEKIYEFGIELVEFPINIDKKVALRCLEKTATTYPDKKVGIGTALTEQDVEDAQQSGAQFIVSPNTNPKVIKKTKELRMFSIAGILTPSEAFSALELGCDAIKIFPITAFPPSALQSLMGVLPKNTIVVPTGNIVPTLVREYFEAGASKIGLGSAIYKIGDNSEQVAKKMKKFFDAIK